MKRAWALLSLLFVVSVGSLLLFGVFRWWQHPSIGAIWSVSGTIEWTLPQGSSPQFGIGDRIRLIDGRPVEQVGLYLGEGPVGDWVTLVVDRSGFQHNVVVQTTHPALAEIIQVSATPLLAIAFWIFGSILLLSSHRHRENRIVEALAGVFFAISALAIEYGSVSLFGPLWLHPIYSASLWLLGLFGGVLHLRFPRSFAGLWSPGVVGALVVAGIGGMMWGLLAPKDYLTTLNKAAHTGAYVWLGSLIVASVVLLIWRWLKSPALDERRQLGVVAVGGLLALVPLLAFTLVPRLVLQTSPSSSNLEMLPLALLPASYTYALLRHRRLAQDKTLARVLVYAFTVATIAILIALLFTIPGAWELPREYLVGLAIVVGALAAGPATRAIEGALGWLLFGRLRKPLHAAAKATDAIDLSIDSDDLTAQVAAILKSQLDIDRCVVLALDEHHRLGDPSRLGLARAAEGLEIKPGSPLEAFLSGDEPVIEFDEARHRLIETSGRALYGVAWAQLMLPLRAQDRLIGLLLTTYRAGASFLDEEDIIVLKLVGQALGTALQRRTLVSELREKNVEASQLSQELMRVRAEERKRIARDLHDDIVQPMIAASYAVASLSVAGAEPIRSTLTDLVDRTRNICFELREPALDNLGFGAAARAVLSAFTQRTGKQVTIRIAESAAGMVRETISAAALGVLDEALTNAHKHAAGQEIRVDVAVNDQILTVSVQDAGPGFSLAQVRQNASQSRHFGLAIMEERAASVGGRLTIVSSVGHGTTIAGHFPVGG